MQFLILNAAVFFQFSDVVGSDVYLDQCVTPNLI